MIVDTNSHQDQARAVETAAALALAAVARLKSAVELRALSALDASQTDRLLRSLDMMLLGAMTCLGSTHAGRPKRMSISRQLANEDIKAFRADHPQEVGRSRCR